MLVFFAVLFPLLIFVSCFPFRILPGTFFLLSFLFCQWKGRTALNKRNRKIDDIVYLLAI